MPHFGTVIDSISVSQRHAVWKENDDYFHFWWPVLRGWVKGAASAIARVRWGPDLFRCPFVDTEVATIWTVASMYQIHGKTRTRHLFCFFCICGQESESTCPWYHEFIGGRLWSHSGPENNKAQFSEWLIDVLAVDCVCATFLKLWQN